MSLDCSKSVSQLNSVKELQKQLIQEVVSFQSNSNSNTKKAEKIEKLTKIYQIRKDIRSGIGQIEYHFRPEYALAEKLKLKEQYDEQVAMLKKLGLLKILPKLNVEGIVGDDKNEYTIPSYDEVFERLKNPETCKLLETKAEQGFTKFIMVPFALPLEKIILTYRDLLLHIDENDTRGIKSSSGVSLDLNTADPVHYLKNLISFHSLGSDPLNKVEYNVLNYEYEGKTKDDRGGKYKDELLKMPNKAWQFLMLEDMSNVPSKGKGKMIAGRQQIEAGESCAEYLNILQTDKQYQGEQGLTSEANFILQIDSLIRNNKVLDDINGNRLVGTCLLGITALDFAWSNNKTDGTHQAWCSWNPSGAGLENYGMRTTVEF